MASRAALSSAAWERGRWRDGRRVILAPHQNDMAMQGATCRVMPSEPKSRQQRPPYGIIGPDPEDEAITMTWDQAAGVLMQPIAMFGIDLNE